MKNTFGAITHTHTRRVKVEEDRFCGVHLSPILAKCFDSCLQKNPNAIIIIIIIIAVIITIIIIDNIISPFFVYLFGSGALLLLFILTCLIKYISCDKMFKTRFFKNTRKTPCGRGSNYFRKGLLKLLFWILGETRMWTVLHAVLFWCLTWGEMFKKTTRRNFRPRRDESGEEGEDGDSRGDNNGTDPSLLGSNLLSVPRRGISCSSKTNSTPPPQQQQVPMSPSRGEEDPEDTSAPTAPAQRITDPAQTHTLSFKEDREGESPYIWTSESSQQTLQLNHWLNNSIN